MPTCHPQHTSRAPAPPPAPLPPAPAAPAPPPGTGWRGAAAPPRRPRCAAAGPRRARRRACGRRLCWDLLVQGGSSSWAVLRQTSHTDGKHIQQARGRQLRPSSHRRTAAHPRPAGLPPLPARAASAAAAAGPLQARTAGAAARARRRAAAAAAAGAARGARSRCPLLPPRGPTALARQLRLVRAPCLLPTPRQLHQGQPAAPAAGP